MQQRLPIADVIGLGLVVFAFFLGAGNIIFPPLEGKLAGEHVVSAIGGFLITAVGLPLISLIAVARAGGGLSAMTRDLPKGVGLFATVLLFIIIGPAFAVPRTGLVAFEMAVKPLWSSANPLLSGQALSTIERSTTALFFMVTLILAWRRGKLIDNIGKLIAPILFLLLLILGLGVIFNPQGEVGAPSPAYQHMAFVKGFIGGYHTMDTFGALMFGMLLIDVLRTKGITAPRACFRYLSVAGGIAAIGLTLVYVSLFWLGATSSSLVGNHVDNGGIVLAIYVQALFGQPGQWILSLVVLLACLTTAVGLVSACADYFSTLTRLTYRYWTVVLCVVCAVVANVGLSRLITLSIPILMALYPLAIALVVLTFIRPRLRNPTLGYRMVMSVTLLCSLMDGLRAAGAGSISWVASLLDWQMRIIPFVTEGMAWVIPTVVTLIIVLLLPEKRLPTQSIQQG